MTDDIPRVSGDIDHLKKRVQATLEDRDERVNWETPFNGGYDEDFIRFFVVALSQDAMGKLVESKGPPFGKNDMREDFELVRSKSGSIAISYCGSACKKKSFV
ncbi:Hypothetical Protein FCC1311_113752 [Hondaea fermentalgiana]|uniref:Uncharacterized protein n=1 Tax=Hondaea fermentalgiana TaxID=2315210 RepID=A0A2R5GWE2_9STRA|nr:Hypothetical Protein FCC1311_113752 [Hondaea fermentalgiana]|eukprot:GBG35152.1 Hypothetical Protein FCC1311_113752 [Hondaea fermentalgiana]